MRVLVSLLAALLAASAATGAAEADEANRPPVALRTPLFLTPEEAAGSGVAPEVKVRATVDSTGRISTVEILSIVPSTELDDAFREAAVETLSTWRYAPAIDGGRPAEAKLSWSIEFKPRDEDDRPFGLQGLLSDTSAESLRARIFLLPLEQRIERLEGYVERGEQYLDRERRRVYASARFQVISDSADKGNAEAVAVNLEATFHALTSLVAEHVEPMPEPYRNVVFIFARREPFKRFAQEMGAPGWVGGLYRAPGLLAFHLEVPSADTLLRVLIHEASHAYTDRHLVSRGRALPAWLGEGFAEYVSNSQIKKGVLIPGRTLEGRYVLSGHGASRRSTDSGLRLEQLERALRGERGLSVADLVGSSSEVFYGPRHRLYYPTAWLFVHFLRHGKEGWAEERFPRFLFYTAEGYPPKQAIAEAYGMDLADLEEPFQEYVKSF